MACFGFIASSELVESCRAAKETLRFRAMMFLAPVTVVLELCNKRLIALGALFFGYAVFDTPPPAVAVIDVNRVW